MRKYQAVVFLPYVLPATAIGISFSFLLQGNGVLNTALRHLHLGALAQDWLGNSHLAIVSVGGLVVWQQLGFGVVVFTAALLALPPETAEAAHGACRVFLGEKQAHLPAQAVSRHGLEGAGPQGLADPLPRPPLDPEPQAVRVSRRAKSAALARPAGGCRAQ